MPSLRAVLAVVAAPLLVSSCAAGVTFVKLRDPRPAGAAEAATTPVTLLAVRDLRPEPAWIGVKRNTSGDAVGEAALANEGPLADLLAEHLRAVFAAQGFALQPGTAEDGSPSVAVEIRRLWAEFRPGAWAREAEAEIELHLDATRAGLPGQAHTFEGKAVASSLGGASGLLDQALNGAYADVLKALEVELASGSLGSLLRASPCSPATDLALRGSPRSE